MTADESPKRSVTVRIAGESHTIRAAAEPDYTRACAEYVDRAVAEVRAAAGPMETHRAVILAALAITDELFRARASLAAAAEAVAGEAGAIRERVERSLRAEG